jgi:hypothetical protein
MATDLPTTNAHASEGGDPFTYGGGKWEERDNRGKSGQPIRFPTCTWCGSITPQQFLVFLEAGYASEVADWKYGWPHKIYLTVPNDQPDELRFCGSTSEGSKLQYNPDGSTYHVKTQETGPERYPEWHPQNGWSQKGTYPTLHLKFYTVHLADLSREQLEKASPMIREKTGIEFTFNEEGKIMWRATPRGRFDGA